MIDQWAARWRIPAEALQDLYRTLSSATQPLQAPSKGQSEAAVQAAVRLEATHKGLMLWRNNVTAFVDSRGVPVRSGLANDSKAMNRHIKSADLIGIRPVLITPEMVGRRMGQFVSREVKERNWHWRGDEHELAQARWMLLVLLAGGDAAIVNGTGSL